MSPINIGQHLLYGSEHESVLCKTRREDQCARFSYLVLLFFLHFRHLSEALSEHHTQLTHVPICTVCVCSPGHLLKQYTGTF